MKNFTKIMAAIALLAFLAFPMGMRGQTRDVETFTFSELGYENAENVTTVEGDNVTLTFDAGTNANNSPKYYNTGAGVRMYAGNTLEVALNDQTGDTRITAIDFTFSGSSYTGGLQNWTGSETSHTFTATGTARIQVITVTFSEGGVAPTTYTVTYYANVTGTAPVVDTYIEGADVTLRDANTFTNDGYTFSEWNTDPDGDGDSYAAGDVINDIDDNWDFYAIWTENMPSDDHWVLTSLADLTTSDVFVIVGNNDSNYAMSNDKGTSNPPTAVAVTVTGNEITSTVAANIQWNISGDATNGYTFYPNGSTTTWLYCTATNNGVRVGTNTNKTFVVDHDYLKHTSTSRYVGIYNSQDWRCYTSYTGTNIAGQTFAFYKKVTGEVLPPSITAANVDIEYNATSGSITYTINNGVEGGALTATTESEWLTLPNTFTSPIEFTCTANEAGTARTATVTLTYTYNRETVTKDVTVTQAAAPVVYNTMQAIFDKATEVGNTATSVNIALQNWVVSGVSTNGKNVFVTDGTKGFVIFNTDGNMGFAVGNVLSGTVSCKVQLYHGFAEITELNSSTEGISIATGGTVTEANIAMAELAGVNTSALVSYDNLTCSVTTSGNNTFYNLSDGTTTIQVYNSLYAFDALVDGKTYNITGVYQQYNNTKEILPRSADDIEEVQVQHNEYTLTVSNLSHVNLFIFAGEESETIISTEDGETTAQVYDGTEVLVSIDVEAGYVFQSLTITDGNGDPVNMEELTANEYYSFVMPTSDVTITASAEVLTGDQYELFTGDELVEGDYLIVYNGKAMNNTVSSNRLQYEEVIATNNVITTDHAAIVWHIAPSGDYWTIYSADAEAYAASTGTKNQATTMADGSDDKALWTASGNYDFVNKYNAANSVNSYLRNNGTYGFACYGTGTGGALSLYKKVEDTPVTETYTLTIEGYGTSAGGYYLIASPVKEVEPTADNGFITDDFDLYMFDESEEDEWINYKQDDDNTGFDALLSGVGYLYASKQRTELEFTGTPYDGDGVFDLNYTEGADMAGWNLVGNPYSTWATVDKQFYIMNGTGTNLIVSETDTVAAMQGIFVKATEPGEYVTFTQGSTEPEGKIVLNVLKNRGNVIDRAIVNFGEGVLPKFQLNPNDTKVYFPQANEEYAVVSSDEEGEMPVNFKANENNTYTLSVNAENVEMEYLHLIDLMTGANINLLANPNYSFEANTTDFASRFKLVFVANNGINEHNSNNFAFFNGSEWVINNEGEATLEVIDMTGRVLNTMTVNGNATTKVNAATGVYMLRLTNGNDVKTQKVVVK
ncbi:MAG: T9SS type A sorting domain-containing protein [Bacteroidales bacterium]|nr:T9SS type A sorting domain-containing protein [Bacteroidales bacterium]